MYTSFMLHTILDLWILSLISDKSQTNKQTNYGLNLLIRRDQVFSFRKKMSLVIGLGDWFGLLGFMAYQPL